MTRRRNDDPQAAAAGEAAGLAGPVLEAELSLRVGGRSVAGARRIALLAEIARVGSIAQAARLVGLSYKGAWDAIEQMGNLAGAALVERSAGGRGGGGAGLTPRGVELVQRYACAEAEHARFVERLNRRGGSIPAPTALLTSARNQFSGMVTAVREGSINDEIELVVIGGQHIVATVTRESRRELGLAGGVAAFALIKASAVRLATCPTGARSSARNRLPGIVQRITAGTRDSEVVLGLAGGGSVAAVFRNTPARSLGLQVGTEALAVFDPSSVIVGIAA